MSSNCSTCSKVTLHYVVWNAGRAAGGAARRFNGGSSERSCRPDLPSMWSGGLSWRHAGSARRRGEGFLLGQEGEKPTSDWSGRGNIMCSHTLHMTLVYVTTPSFPVYRDV